METAIEKMFKNRLVVEERDRIIEVLEAVQVELADPQDELRVGIPVHAKVRSLLNDLRAAGEGEDTVSATFDPEADAIYVTLRAGQQVRTVEVDTTLHLDLDADGNTLGVEILTSKPPVRVPEKGNDDA